MSQLELTAFEPADEGCCPTCGDVFKNKHGMRIHHAQVHGEHLGVVEKVCQECGAEYETVEVRSDGSRYCSNECKHQARRKRTTITCAECGESIEVRDCETGQMFCDEVCYTEAKKARQGEDANGWRGGSVTLSCEICGGDFEVDPNMADRRVTCSKECFGEHISNLPRTEQPAYIGAAPVSFYRAVRRELDDQSWRQTREEHREKQPTCEQCGAEPDDGSANHVHHIVPVLAGGTNDEELLMTLCERCHFRAEHYTAEYIPRVLSPHRWTDS